MIDGKLGVAIHGVGQVAYAHAASWIRNPHAEIVSVSSRNPASAAALVEHFQLKCQVAASYDQVLDDPTVDIVNLSGPNQVHAEQGVAAAEAGKHVLVEKPIALTMDENRRLRDAVADAGVKSIVSFVLRWNPLLETLQSLRSSGAIGRLIYLEVDYWHGLGPAYTGWSWAHTVKTGGSANLLAGCHALDALRWLAGRAMFHKKRDCVPTGGPPFGGELRDPALEGLRPGGIVGPQSRQLSDLVGHHLRLRRDGIARRTENDLVRRRQTMSGRTARRPGAQSQRFFDHWRERQDVLAGRQRRQLPADGWRRGVGSRVHALGCLLVDVGAGCLERQIQCW
jgi:hypothetical protein